jgi:hypothetical protein
MLAVAASGRTHAQDFPLTMRGSVVTPARSSEVALHNLSVEHEYLPDREAFRVQTQLELENRSAHEIKLQLGLAEPRCESDSDEEDACSDPTAIRFTDLETKLRDAVIPTAKHAQLDRKHEWAPALGNVWLFDVKLKPSETAKLEHRYVLPASPAAGGGMSAGFVTRTGSAWAEPIDKAVFTFILPVNSCLVVEPEHIARRNRRVVLREGQPFLQLTYAAQRWTPKTDVALHFETCIPPRDTELQGCSLVDALASFTYGASPDNDTPPPSRDELKRQLVQLSDIELKTCDNAVFEAYASYYKPEELAVLAKRPVAARHFTGPLLTPDDWKWVGIVDEAIAQKASMPKPQAKPKDSGAGCTIAGGPKSSRSFGMLLLLAAGWLGRRAARSRARRQVA